MELELGLGFGDGLCWGLGAGHESQALTWEDKRRSSTAMKRASEAVLLEPISQTSIRQFLFELVPCFLLVVLILMEAEYM